MWCFVVFFFMQGSLLGGCDVVDKIFVVCIVEVLENSGGVY